MGPTHQFTCAEMIDAGRTTQSDVDAVRAWLADASSPSVPQTLTDVQIVMFLLSCNNDHEATRATIIAHFKCKENCPEIHDNRTIDADDVKQALKTIDLAVLPVWTKDENVVIMGRLKDFSYWNFVLPHACKLFCMGMELALCGAPPRGAIVILDFKGVGLMHMTRLRLSILKKFFQYIQEGMPVQLRSVHIINVVYFFDKLMTIVKPFMKKELMELINVHAPGADMAAFCRDCVAADSMPADYGGRLPPLNTLTLQTCERFRQNETLYRALDDQVNGHSARFKSN